MSTTTADAEVRNYIEAVRAHLDYLPEDDRDELLEDLEEHLHEVAAEDDGTLEQRLGPPGLYAEELRVSAGLASGDRPSHRGFVAWALGSSVARRARTLARWARRSRRFHIALLLGVVLAVGVGVGRGSVSPPYIYDEAIPTDSSLRHADGASIANICPYAADGKLLTGILLFDQDGRPVTNTAPELDGRQIEVATPAILNVYPKAISFVDLQASLQTKPDGTTNVTKALTPLHCPASVAAPPASSPAP